MKINKRLKKISELIEDNSFILDVGCDHALLDIYVCLNKNCNAIASDINENPLKFALENINKYQLTNKILLVKGNGLEKITNDVDTVVISGMGSILISLILQKDFRFLKNVNRIIISPNNEEEIVRRFLCSNGYYILNEELVLDRKKIYPIIVFEKGNKNYSKLEINYGPILIQKKDDLFSKYYENKLNILKNIKNNLSFKYLFKKILVNKKIRDLKKIL